MQPASPRTLPTAPIPAPQKRLPDAAITMRPGHRPELQGLRAVAIGMVVVYHVFLDRVSGGVDVFLLISAFLLTGSFAAKLESGAPLRIGRYWIKAFKRLLPPAVVTIAGVLLLTYLFFPAYRWREILNQAIASTLYTENWHLAAAAIDYYAADRSLASPLQHFWSLSIQGQVFVVWPLLFLGARWLIRRYGWDTRRTLGVLFGTVFFASLGWSIWETATVQAHAYFSSFTRLWEFALGSLLAIGLPLLERAYGFGPGLPGRRGPVRAARVVAGWVGLVGMLSCGLLVTVEGSFPGWIALWPLLSACLIIAAGHTGSRWGVDHLLAGRPLSKLGDMSYGVYLVHWPLLITLLVVQDASRAGAIEGLILIALSVRAGSLLTRYVDAPIRFSRSLALLPGRAVLVIALAVAVGITPSLLIQSALDRQTARILAGAALNNPGAAVLLGSSSGPQDPDAPPIPLPEDIKWDWGNIDDLSCKGPYKPTDPSLAAACRQTATGEPGKVIVAVGNSRTQQMIGSYLPLAEANGYTIVSIIKSGCPLDTTTTWEGCLDWNVELRDYLVALHPAAVVTNTTQIDPGQREKRTPGVEGLIGDLTGAGIAVIGFRDAPRLPWDPPACLHERSEEQCTVPTRGMFGEAELNRGLASSVRGSGAFHPIDLTDYFCPGGECVPIIGNVHVYMDAVHPTRTYVRTIAPEVDRQLSSSGWRW